MAEYQRKPRWTSKQETFVMMNYKTMKDEEMANILGRSLKSVRHKRQRLELEKYSAGMGVVCTSKRIKNDDGQKNEQNENSGML